MRRRLRSERKKQENISQSALKSTQIWLRLFACCTCPTALSALYVAGSLKRSGGSSRSSWQSCSNNKLYSCSSKRRSGYGVKQRSGSANRLSCCSRRLSGNDF